MEKICLVEGGNFLLGIDIFDIVASKTLEEFVTPDQEQSYRNEDIYHLESLFSQQPFFTINADSIVLQLKTDVNFLFLIVDRVLDEIEAPDSKELLPPLYPSLAEQLCPQVVIYENSIVMVLDTTQVIPIHEKLQTGFGSVSIKELLQTVEPPIKELVPDIVTNDKQHEEKFSLIDDETFELIVFWTIAKYKKCKSGDTFEIDANELPIDLIRQKGLSNAVLQYLIDQTILRCKKTFGQ